MIWYAYRFEGGRLFVWGFLNVEISLVGIEFSFPFFTS